jgi:hypothetical protein
MPTESGSTTSMALKDKVLAVLMTLGVVALIALVT